jgi:hypothetical protein
MQHRSIAALDGRQTSRPKEREALYASRLAFSEPGLPSLMCNVTDARMIYREVGNV